MPDQSPAALWAKCAEPTDDGVPFPLVSRATYVLLNFFLVLCPPVFVLLAGAVLHRRTFRLPLCPPHRADWQWRDRLTTRTYLAAVSVTYVIAPVLGCLLPLGPDPTEAFGRGLLAYSLAWVAWIFHATILWTRTSGAVRSRAGVLGWPGFTRRSWPPSARTGPATPTRPACPGAGTSGTTTTTRRTDMARVTVTDYELEHDLLPPVCVRCGAPAADRVVQTLHIIDGWSGVLLTFGILFGLFFFPPLVRVLLRCGQSASARLPMCPPHRDEHRGRDRWADRVLLPVWTAAALVGDGLLVVDFVTGVPPGGLCYAPVVVLITGTVAAVSVSRGRVGMELPDKTGLRLAGLSEAFVTALAHDRARDRVNNPDRRGGRGDMRDDYDDEAV